MVDVCAYSIYKYHREISKIWMIALMMSNGQIYVGKGWK